MTAAFVPAVLITAAVAEIGGCWLVYAVLRGGASPLLLLPALLLLAAFAGLLTLVETGGAGRTFAVYGGIYVAASLVWLALVEGVRPTATDVGGGLVMLAGAALIYLGRS